MSQPKRQDYDSDDAFLEAMAGYYEIPLFMIKRTPATDDTIKSFMVKTSVSTGKSLVPEIIEIARLNERIERLTKAGDDMAKVITEFRCGPRGNYVPNAFWIWQAWHTAKKGEQP